jgi:acetyl esterase
MSRQLSIGWTANRPASAVGLLLMAMAMAFAAEPSGKVMVYKTVQGQAQEMEVYFPQDHNAVKTKVPGVLLFHGGGWSNGDLAQFRHACDYFAKRGLVAATANYRMHTKAEADQLPAGISRKRVCITDARSAIRWMKSHADEWGMDPQRLIVGGGSAGGHLAVLSSMKSGLDDPQDDVTIDTTAVAWLLFNPAFTLDDKDGDPHVDVFPHLRPKLPPAIFFFGTKDHWMPASEVLVTKLGAHANQASMWIAVDQGHSFWFKNPWYDLTLAECDRFLVGLGLLQGTGPAVQAAPGQQLVRSP